jgi:DNA-binding transcriptional regulator YiaG
MWHNGGMVEEKIDKKANKKPVLRYSFPPYYVGTIENDIPIVSLPGENYEIVERSLATSAGEARGMLLTLRRELRWSRPMLSAYMGVSRESLRRWETGERNPNGAARRLIWLLNQLAFHPKKLKSAMDLLFWGRGKELRKFSRLAKK